MDPIADMLVKIKNALKKRDETVDLPHSRVKEGIARIFMAEGFFSKCDTLTRMNKKFLRIGLKYTGDKKSIIAGLRRASRPGRRIYVGNDSIPQMQAGFGTVVLSTSRGLMTDEQAREQKLGGEVVCYIW